MLNQENYYSNEINKEYMSVSLFKDFEKCEAAAYAKLNGDWEPKSDITPLLVGNFVHSYFEGEEAHKEFLARTEPGQSKSNQELMMTKPTKKEPNGHVRAEFKVAQRMIDRLAGDETFQRAYVDGEKEVIVTGEVDGIKWRGKLDSYREDLGMFFDIKTNADLHKKHWDNEEGKYTNFVKAFGYYMQMAMYRELINQTFEVYAQPIIFGVSKQEPCDIMGISFESEEDEQELENAMLHIKALQSEFRAVLEGKQKPKRCGDCEYCRSTNKIDRFINASKISFR